MTAQAFGPAEPADQRMRIVPAPERLPVVPGFEDLVYEARPLLVVPDSRGRVLNWIHALAQPWYAAVVVLTSQATPLDYLEYLNRRGIAHLSAGEDRTDLSAALELLQCPVRCAIDAHRLRRPFERLFTDIVGSTDRARQLGDRRWRQVLTVHDELTRRVVEEFQGRLVETTGDGILATFDGPGRAIRCAAAIREELAGIGLQIRAGLHTGEIELRESGVGGIAVHIAARVMATAGPGEIHTSRTVRDLVVGSDIAMDDLGTHPLKGVEGNWQLFAAKP